MHETEIRLLTLVLHSLTLKSQSSYANPCSVAIPFTTPAANVHAATSSLFTLAIPYSSMDSFEYASALLLLQLMHAFLAEKQAQREPLIDGTAAATCRIPNGISEAESFLFRNNDLKFRGAQEVFDAAIAYLARPNPFHVLQPSTNATKLLSTSDTGDSGLSPVLLVIMGADSLPLVQDASSAFIESWHAAGCRRIVITGGIGRATPDLIKSFKKRSAQADAGLDRGKSEIVSLPFAHALGGPQSLPLLHDYSSFSVSWHPSVVAQYVTEADIFAEVVLEALQGAGISVKYSRAAFDEHGTLKMQPPLSWSSLDGDNSVSVWVEPGSTHTGTNVDHTIALLAAANVPPLSSVLPSTIIVQHPALLARSAATFHKKAGFSPMRWTSTRHYEDRNCSWAAAKGLSMALAEYQRFPAYSNELGFVVAPDDLPWEICEFANLPEVKSANDQLAAELHASMEAALLAKQPFATGSLLAT